MGSCFGHCFNGRSRRSQQAQRTKYFRGSDSIEPAGNGSKCKRTSGISYLLTFNKNKRPTPRDMMSANSSVGPHFQPLDARSLLTRGLRTPSRTSTPASTNSLDLEWENEGGIPMVTHHYHTETESTRGATSTWSRLSSPDSLEWDPIDAEIQTSSLDVETEQLLSEIERLTSRALRETGDGSS